MKNYLAFDIGGTAIKYGVIQEGGTFLYNDKFPNVIRSQGVEQMLQDVIAKALELQKQYELSGVGISTSGVVDIISGEILRSADTFPGYTGQNPGARITEATGLPCVVDNDVNCAVLGEHLYGSAVGKNSVCCIALGTGIGGATILDGKMLYGKSYFAGEIGHFPVTGGEMEKVGSTYALVRNVAQRKGLPEAEVNGLKIFQWAKEGDQDAIDGINIMMRALAEGITNILYAINPEAVVIGGAVAAQEEYLRPILMEKLEKLVMPDLLAATEIVFSKLDNTASMLGAVATFIEAK